jgi:hypothetical protein
MPQGEVSMHISVNKKTNVKRPVKYAALSSGTISHVWYDEETAAIKRQNRIKLTREQAQAVKASKDNFDA